MKNDPQCSISLVVVNYNAGKLLLECLKSAIFHVDEIIVVDNASGDDSFDQCINEFSFQSEVKFIQNKSNLGFATACNQGFVASVGATVLFLNPDCRLYPDSVALIYDSLWSDSNCAMAGGQLINSDGSEQAGGRRAVPTPWRSFVRAFGLVKLSSRWPSLFNDFNLHHQPLPELPVSVEAISGACLMVKREALESVGLWDESYFLHCEDLDLCMKFRQKKWEILFIPDAKVVHAQGGCSYKRPIFVEWHKHRSMLRFYRKHFQAQYPLGLMFLVGVGIWIRFCMVVVVKLKGRKLVAHE